MPCFRYTTGPERSVRDESGARKDGGHKVFRCVPDWDKRKIASAPGERSLYRLPAPGLQHVGLIKAADGKAFHGSLEVFADFK